MRFQDFAGIKEALPNDFYINGLVRVITWWGVLLSGGRQREKP